MKALIVLVITMQFAQTAQANDLPFQVPALKIRPPSSCNLVLSQTDYHALAQQAQDLIANSSSAGGPFQMRISPDQVLTMRVAKSGEDLKLYVADLARNQMISEINFSDDSPAGVFPIQFPGLNYVVVFLSSRWRMYGENNGGTKDVIVVDPVTGKKVNEFEIDQGGHDSVYGISNRVYITRKNILYRVDVMTGDLTAIKTLDGPQYDIVYGFHTQQGDQLVLARENGIWSKKDQFIRVNVKTGATKTYENVPEVRYAGGVFTGKHWYLFGTQTLDNPKSRKLIRLDLLYGDVKELPIEGVNILTEPRFIEAPNGQTLVALSFHQKIYLVDAATNEVVHIEPYTTSIGDRYWPFGGGLKSIQIRPPESLK